MVIAIAHEIHDPRRFQTCSKEVSPLPDGRHLEQAGCGDRSWCRSGWLSAGRPHPRR